MSKKQHFTVNCTWQYSALLAVSYPQPHCCKFKVGTEVEVFGQRKKERKKWGKTEQLELSVTFIQHLFSSVLRTTEAVHILQIKRTTYTFFPLQNVLSPLGGKIVLVHTLVSSQALAEGRKEKWDMVSCIIYGSKKLPLLIFLPHFVGTFMINKSSVKINHLFLSHVVIVCLGIGFSKWIVSTWGQTLNHILFSRSPSLHNQKEHIKALFHGNTKL